VTLGDSVASVTAQPVATIIASATTSPSLVVRTELGMSHHHPMLRTYISIRMGDTHRSPATRWLVGFER
jgi:hypothetical protein